MNNDFLKLKEHIESLGIKNGDDVLIHSSYKSLGGGDEGRQTFFDMFFSVLGDSGTLLFPTLSFSTGNPAPSVNNSII